MLLVCSVRRLMRSLRTSIRAKRQQGLTPYSSNLGGQSSNGVPSFLSSHTNNLHHHLTVPSLTKVRLGLHRPLRLQLASNPSPTNGSLTNRLDKSPSNIFDLTETISKAHHTTRLSPHLQNWYKIMQDSWVLNIISSGYRLEFIELPPLGWIKSTSFDPILEEEILALLAKQAIQKVPLRDIQNGFYSRYFTVPKKDSGLRLILDLRDLNTYLRPCHFRMVTLEGIIHLLKKGDWFVVVDLKDAYFHITIHQKYRKYLRLSFMDTICQYVVLPFGLSTAPTTFTKCMALVAAYLRLQGIQMYPYIDDWLIVSRSRGEAVKDTQQVLHTLQALGLTINYDKSHLEPLQVMDCIGACSGHVWTLCLLACFYLPNVSRRSRRQFKSSNPMAESQHSLRNICWVSWHRQPAPYPMRTSRCAHSSFGYSPYSILCENVNTSD
uniref:ribonuclease H n=1 Tax=Pogona vitticeps TaxID=103695 RepID=A0ABM5G4X1_9SAUR